MDPVLKRSEGYWSMLWGSFSFRFSFLSWGLEFCEGGRASSLDFAACQRGEGIQKGTRETHGRGFSALDGRYKMWDHGDVICSSTTTLFFQGINWYVYVVVLKEC